MLVERFSQGEELSAAERLKVSEIVEDWRSRLMDLSWFMRCLNEHVARRANEGDRCKGRFWEGRFRSQALLDEQALITCMTYVDLNPIRAGVAQTPETSDYTSVQERLTSPDLGNAFLLPFRGDESLNDSTGIAFVWPDYLQFLDWTGRAIRDDKRGAISEECPPIFARLGIDQAAFVRQMKREETGFADVVGCAHRLRQTAVLLGLQFLKGVSSAKRLYPSLC